MKVKNKVGFSSPTAPIYTFILSALFHRSATDAKGFPRRPRQRRTTATVLIWPERHRGGSFQRLTF